LIRFVSGFLCLPVTLGVLVADETALQVFEAAALIYGVIASGHSPWAYWSSPARARSTLAYGLWLGGLVTLFLLR